MSMLMLGAAPALQMRAAAPAMLIREQVGSRPMIGDMMGMREPGSITVQGGSLRTWSFDYEVEQVQVVLSSEGRSLDADIEVWHGPGNKPCKMRIYVEDANQSPFSCVIETPRGDNTVAIRNIGPVEFPIIANMVVDGVDRPSMPEFTPIQGGALRTFPFEPFIEAV